MPFSFNPFLGNLDYYQSGSGTSSWKNPVANVAALPLTGNSIGDARIAKDTGIAWEWNGSSWQLLNVVQPSAVGSTPNTDGFSVDATTNTVTLQPADNTNPGVLTAGTQTIGGNKTLSGTTNLSALTASLPLKLDASKNITSAAIGLASTDVSGVLSIANGGTNSSTTLNNNRVMVSNAGSIVEQAAITANRALASDSSGLLVASSTTDTELEFVSGVTSSIQTQLNATEKTANKGIANGYAPLDGAAKIPVAYLPNAVFIYQGTWDPTTNTPILIDGTGTTGSVYYVSAAFAGPVVGLTDPSMINFQIGDLVIYNGTKYELTTPSAGVKSVNGTQGIVIVNAINQLTGDATAGPASGSQSQALTLATVNSNVGTFSPATITVNTKGLVTAASSVTTGNLTDTGTDGITVTGGTSAVIGTGTAISQHVADATHNGYLASADFVTFAAKQPAGAYITALTGAVTASGPGSATATLTDTSVTAALLTGYTVGSNSAVLATDTILAAFGKVQSQINAIEPSGDIETTTFSAAASQTNQPVTGLTFANASVHGFSADLTIATSASLFEKVTLNGIQRTADWQMTAQSAGDLSGYTFTINTSGQVLYSSPAATATLRFRARIL